MSAFFEDLLENPVNLVATVISLIAVVAGLVYLITSPKMVWLAVKNLRRNLLRTLLTSMAIMVLVMMVTLIWTVVYFLDKTTTEKAADFKLIVTERWQLPSQMPLTHADYLNPESPKFLPDLQGLYVAEGLHDLVVLWRHDRSQQDVPGKPGVLFRHEPQAHPHDDGRSGKPR